MGHPSKLLIIDLGDLHYVGYGVFIKEELDEMLSFEEKRLSLRPLYLLKHINKYNLSTPPTSVEL
jgi:hypothetical protein